MTAAALAAQACTKCGETRPMDAFGIRHDRGQPYRQCRDCMAARKWAKKNPERHREQQRAYAEANREDVRRIWRDMAKRKRERPDVRVHQRMSNRIWYALRGGKGGSPTFELLGYTKQELLDHLERQFVRGMSWKNMGEWHIDHIVPLSSFEISDIDDPAIQKAWALANLRPLWAAENMSKGAKMEFLI